MIVFFLVELMVDIYEKRIDNFFEYRDGKCCERIYKEILKLQE